MNGLLEWVKNISCVLLFLSLVSYLFPNEQYGRYGKIFLGMMTVYVVFQPLAQAFSFENYVEQYTDRYWDVPVKPQTPDLTEAERYAYEVSAAEYERVLREEVTDFCEAEGWQVLNLDLRLETEPESGYGKVTSLRLLLSPARKQEGMEAAEKETLVAPVVIQSGTELSKLPQKGETQDPALQKSICEKFSIQAESVVITFQEAAYE